MCASPSTPNPVNSLMLSRGGLLIVCVALRLTAVTIPSTVTRLPHTLAGAAAWQTAAVIRRSNPSGLHGPPGYHHVTIADATSLVFLAGQCPLDAQGELVGPGDLMAQVEQVSRNITTALFSVGATSDDVVRTVIYVVTFEQRTLSAVWTALRGSNIAAALTSASTLLGVGQLGYAGQLVEIDVTAALSR